MRNEETKRDKRETVQITKSTKELGIIAVAGGGQDVVSDNMANGTPSKNINNVKANWVVGFEEANIFLGTNITGFKVGDSILLGQALFGHVLSLEVEEDEPAQEQGEASAEADDKWCVQLSFNAAEAVSFGGGGELGEGGFGPGVEGS